MHSNHEKIITLNCSTNNYTCLNTANNNPIEVSVKKSDWMIQQYWYPYNICMIGTDGSILQVAVYFVVCILFLSKSCSLIFAHTITCYHRSGLCQLWIQTFDSSSLSVCDRYRSYMPEKQFTILVLLHKKISMSVIPDIACDGLLP